MSVICRAGDKLFVIVSYIVTSKSAQREERARLILKCLLEFGSASYAGFLKIVGLLDSETRHRKTVQRAAIKRPHYNNFIIFRTTQQFYTKFLAVIKRKYTTHQTKQVLCNITKVCANGAIFCF